MRLSYIDDSKCDTFALEKFQWIWITEVLCFCPQYCSTHWWHWRTMENIPNQSKKISGQWSIITIRDVMDTWTKNISDQPKVGKWQSISWSEIVIRKCVKGEPGCKALWTQGKFRIVGITVIFGLFDVSAWLRLRWLVLQVHVGKDQPDMEFIIVGR